MSIAREKSVKCRYCNKYFGQQSQLTVHIRQHTGEKPFVCGYCSKGFASSKVLKVHERVHTGERPYKCPYCEKSFSAYANLVVHRRIHTNEKPYSCKLCCRGFEHSGNLSRHFRAHTLDSGFRCILCGKIFVVDRDLLEHTKDDHPNDYKAYMAMENHLQIVATTQLESRSRETSVTVGGGLEKLSETTREPSKVNGCVLNSENGGLETAPNEEIFRSIRKSKSTMSLHELPGKKIFLERNRQDSECPRKNKKEVTSSHKVKKKATDAIQEKCIGNFLPDGTDYLLSFNNDGFKKNSIGPVTANLTASRTNRSSSAEHPKRSYLKLYMNHMQINSRTDECQPGLVGARMQPSELAAPPPLIPIDKLEMDAKMSLLESLQFMKYGKSRLKNDGPLQNCAKLRHYGVSLEEDLLRRPVIGQEKVTKDSFLEMAEQTLCSLVGEQAMNYFGYPEKNCEQVLIRILDMANKSPCADVRVNETERMKINFHKLIECGFPDKMSWQTQANEDKLHLADVRRKESKISIYGNSSLDT